MSEKVTNVEIKTADIKVDQFLKWANLVNSGGEAKELIAAGQVKVNGIVETKRGRRLKDGDVVEVATHGKIKVTQSP